MIFSPVDCYYEVEDVWMLFQMSSSSLESGGKTVEILSLLLEAVAEVTCSEGTCSFVPSECNITSPGDAASLNLASI